MTLQLGILLALCCAVATNLGFLFKHRGACAAPDVSLRHPVASAAGLFRSKWFAIGMLVATGAWIFHVAALALAPLSVVQAVIAGGLVLLTVGVLLVLSPKFGVNHEHHGVLLGTAAGVLFGVSDVAIKALTGSVGDL